VLQAFHDQSAVGIIRRRDNDGVYAVVLDQGLLILENLTSAPQLAASFSARERSRSVTPATLAPETIALRVSACLVPMPPVPITPTEISSE
jgi:hypothetical protein